MKSYSQQDRHEMRLALTHNSGAEEWFCPACGRRFVMHCEPEHGKLKILVLEAGDELAAHHGSRHGIQLGDVQLDKTRHLH